MMQLKPAQSGHLDKVFVWFLSSDSDAQFRANYARSADDIMTALNAWVEDDDIPGATAIADLLVWAFEVLSRDKTLSSLGASSLPGVDLLEEEDETSSLQFAKMLKSLSHRSSHKVVGSRGG